MDDYYMYATGVRQTPAPKPAQHMPGTLREILGDLEIHHPRGYLSIACALLEMDGDARADFAEFATMQRRKTLADGEFHDFSILMDDGLFGFTLMFASEEYGTELAKRLLAYCTMKKYQAKTDRWYGLGCFADAPGWTHVGVPLEYLWEHDDELEKLVAKALPDSDAHFIDLRKQNRQEHA